MYKKQKQTRGKGGWRRKKERRKRTRGALFTSGTSVFTLSGDHLVATSILYRRDR